MPTTRNSNETINLYFLVLTPLDCKKKQVRQFSLHKSLNKKTNYSIIYQNLVLIFKENAFNFSFYHVSERMKYQMRNRNKQFRISLYRKCQKLQPFLDQFNDRLRERQANIKSKDKRNRENYFFVFFFFLFVLIFRYPFRINLRIVNSFLL